MAEQVARGRRAAVAAGHAAEVEAALVTLEAGGNAIDAMVAGAFCACVVEPNNAGLAGYGHLSAWLPEQREFFTVDHGPRAPAAARGRHVHRHRSCLRAPRRLAPCRGPRERARWPRDGRARARWPGSAPHTDAVAGSRWPSSSSPRSPRRMPASRSTGTSALTILQRLHDIRLQPSRGGCAPAERGPADRARRLGPRVTPRHECARGNAQGDRRGGRGCVYRPGAGAVHRAARSRKPAAS